MIEFHFVVSDEEAEIIFDCIQNRVVELNFQQLSSYDPEVEWIKRHVKMSKEIMLKIDNKKI